MTLWAFRKFIHLKYTNTSQCPYHADMLGNLHYILSFNFPVFYPVLHRNEKKEAFFKEKAKEKINEKRKEELKNAEKKDKQAIDEYEKWLVGGVFFFNAFPESTIHILCVPLCDCSVPDFSAVCVCLLTISTWKLPFCIHPFLPHTSYCL